MSSNEFFALHTFRKPIEVKKEVLGSIHETIINGISVTIQFPMFPTEKKTFMECTGSSNPLLCPDKLHCFGQFSKTEWGCVTGMPQGISSVKAVAVFIKCPNEKTQEVAQKLTDGTAEWEERLFHYQRLLFHGITNQFPDYYNGLTCFDTNCKHISVHHSVKGECFCVVDFEGKEAAGLNQIEEILQFASSDKQLRMEYVMLLAAYNARDKGDYRQAVIEAACALDFMMFRKIRALCQENGLDHKQYEHKESLESRFNHLKGLDNSIPVKDIKYISDLRNGVAHNWKPNVNREEVLMMIKQVNVLMEHYHNSYVE